MNVAEQLSLDTERLAVAVDVYEGFANASSGAENLESMVVQGSCLAIAASFAAAIDVERSKKLFHLAAESYNKQAHLRELVLQEGSEQPKFKIHEGKMSFARILAVCGTDANQVGDFVEMSSLDERPFQAPDTVASLLLAESMMVMSGKYLDYRAMHYRLIEESEMMHSYEIGRVRLPLSHFVKVANLSNRKDGLRSIQDVAVAVLSRVEDTIEGAIKSSRWKSLQSSILPIEPEVLGICITLDGACRKATDGKSNLIDTVSEKIGRIANAYVMAAVEFNGRGGGWGKSRARMR